MKTTKQTAGQCLIHRDVCFIRSILPLLLYLYVMMFSMVQFADSLGSLHYHVTCDESNDQVFFSFSYNDLFLSNISDPLTLWI